MHHMIRIVLIVLMAAGWIGLASASENVVAIENVHVLSMQPEHGEAIQHSQTVVIEGNRIIAIGAQGSVVIPEHAQRIDGGGNYLLPGLAEMHGHVPPLRSFTGVPERYLDDVLYLYLAGGVTTVRGMLGHPHQLQLKTDIAAGTRHGPTLYLAGPSFNSNTVETPYRARLRVQEHVQEGWDLLKIHPGLTLAQYQALAAEAKAQGIDFAGHIPDDVGIHHAIILGTRTVDHLDGYLAAIDGLENPVTDAQLRELAQFTRAHNVGVVPTQALWQTIIGAGDAEALRAYSELQYVPQAVRQGWLNYLDEPRSSYFGGESAQQQQENRMRLLAIMYEEGVEILMGTDAPQLFSVPGLSIRRELPLMAAAGMSNYDIIRSGTERVGAYFREHDQFGTIKIGSRADILLVRENPLEQLDTLNEPELVIAAGRIYTRSDIAAKLAEIAAAYAE